MVLRPTTATTWSSSPARGDRPAEDRQRVHQPELRVDQGRVVVLPAGLVLLRAAVVVDGEHRAAHLARGRAEVDRRLAAVGPDLERRPVGEPLPRPAVQQQPLVLGHEPLGGPGVLRAGPRACPHAPARADPRSAGHRTWDSPPRCGGLSGWCAPQGRGPARGRCCEYAASLALLRGRAVAAVLLSWRTGVAPLRSAASADVGVCGWPGLGGGFAAGAAGSPLSEAVSVPHGGGRRR